MLRIVFWVLLFPFGLYAQVNQVGIGQWRVHPSYVSPTSIAIAKDKIYCATLNSFFYIDQDNQFTTLSKINGLNDVNVSIVSYSSEMDLLIIAYSNGNIDILKNDVIINVNDIARKSIIGNKSINHITFYKQYAFLSCNFGVVVLDCKKYEVKDTYNNLSPDGIITAVYSSTILHDTLFIATSRGVMAGEIASGLNLQDYSNWFTYASPFGINPISVETFNDKLIAAFGTDGAFYLQDQNWNKIVFDQPNQSIYKITNTEGKVLICANNLIYSLNADMTTKQLDGFSNKISDIAYDHDGNIWTAVVDNALFTNKFSPGKFKPYEPNGPFTGFAWDLSYHNNTIVGVPGGYKQSTQRNERKGGYYTFDNTTWNNHDITYKFPVLVLDVVKSYYNPNNKNLYLASFGSGLFAVKPDSSIIRYDTSNSTLTPAYFDHPFVGDMKADSKGRLWVVNTLQIVPSSLPSLHVMNSNGTWGTPKTFNSSESLYLIELEIDDNNFIWLRAMSGKPMGLIVYDPAKDRTKYLNTDKGNGGLRSNTVQCITKDKKGQIWVGTDKGISVFYQPYTIFNNSNFDAASPYVAEGFPVLFDQSINCIKVDGGNRKWIGTNKGVWLFNEDGTAPVLNFTSENSPLITNNILDIEINDVTGEVFFATDGSLISYRGTATGAEDTFGEVKVFPNPVPPGFSGTLGITGLATNVEVKITDVVGNLVYQTKSQGGMATWNGKKYNGQKSPSGTYLVFSMNEDGTEKLVSKFAIVE